MSLTDLKYARIEVEELKSTLTTTQAEVARLREAVQQAVQLCQPYRLEEKGKFYYRSRFNQLRLEDMPDFAQYVGEFMEPFEGVSELIEDGELRRIIRSQHKESKELRRLLSNAANALEASGFTCLALTEARAVLGGVE